MRRSQLFVRRTRSLSKPVPVSRRALVFAVRTPRLSTPRQSTASSTNQPRSNSLCEEGAPPLLRTTFSPGPPDEEGPDPESVCQNGEPESEVAPKGVAHSVSDSRLPTGLNIVWSPQTRCENFTPLQSALPPQEILDQALARLSVTFHPLIQHKATYSSALGPPVEPTLALYCPIEGGDYILDTTVRKLGSLTGADVVVIDAAQLAAGESGHFGKAASALQLKHNPLHLESTTQRENRDDSEDHYMMPPQLTMQILGHSSSPRTDRTVRSVRGSASSAQLKAFFGELINVVAPMLPGTMEQPARRPRIIYIRDYPTLAASSTIWYPPLLAAVRERRQGALARPTSPVLHPTTIIFGASPSIIETYSHAPPLKASSKHPRPEHGEDDAADKARGNRLRERLRKWEKGDTTLHDDIPRLFSETQDLAHAGNGPSPLVVVDGLQGVASSIASMFSRLEGRGRASVASSGETEQPGSFFRTSVILPAVRSLLMEKTHRMNRRREINELTMRMAVSSVGGVLGKLPKVQEGGNIDGPFECMWKDWGHAVKPWADTKSIADRVVGNSVCSQKEVVPTLAPCVIQWPAVFEAWATFKGLPAMRKAWTTQGPEKEVPREDGEEDEPNGEEKEEVDEVIEQIRRDAEEGELDEYDQELLKCIVNTASISTTFNQVHLPPHTIDGVRTIVSLPLLHPDAFAHGILKEHSMTGCLLFGPPGTGKTLLVRALAKEAGCRMLAISPSDVMDMYVGEAEKSVRAIFSLARRLAPCVVFIDEIDALFGARSSRSLSGGDHAHRGVITEFMQEMDGLKSNKEDNIMIIGATNRPFDLDDAVLRRLPRRLLVDLPGEKEREEILRILLRDEILDRDVDIQVLARKTDIFSGSDLKHLCVSAALDSVKERVDVPWRKARFGELSQPLDLTSDTDSATPDKGVAHPPRTLSWRNFEAALREITPSSSESLGSLADLRRWNQEFGEGRKERKEQVWGKGRFGFTVETSRGGEGVVHANSLDTTSIQVNRLVDTAR